MDIEHLLTAARSARKSLDLDAPVDLADIRECLRIGLQAANGSNQQSWRWLVIADPALRERIAALYREAYLLRVGGQMLAHLLPPDTPEARLMSSTEWLVENMAKVPLLVIPCYEPYMPRIDGDESFYRATLYGSIFPAVWNFQLALHTRGMDRLDRELLRSAYHDDAIDDHVGFVGPVDEFIDWAFTYHAAQTRHQHYLTNHTAEVNRDEAHAQTYYIFVGTESDPARPLTIAGGRYIDRLQRRDGRWAIAARVCLVEWQTESISLLTPEAVEFLAPIQTVARDRTDTSYERPLVINRAASNPV